MTLELFLPPLMDTLQVLLQVSTVAKPVAAFTTLHFLHNLQIEQHMLDTNAGKHLP
jgi:hypothetical protein